MEVAIMLTTEKNSKYRIPAVAGSLFVAGCLTVVTSIVVAQEAPAKVATAQFETLLQTTHSWNGKHNTHYPIGQPQLTTLNPNAVYVLSGTLTLHDRASGKTLVVHQWQAVGESVDDVHEPRECAWTSYTQEAVYSGWVRECLILLSGGVR
jgi:hypothetical protein